MMKRREKKRIMSIMLVLGILCSGLAGVEPIKTQAATAAKYEHLTVSSGFNADVVATSSTTTNAEGINYTASLDSGGTAGTRACFYSKNYSTSSGYLPTDNIIVDRGNNALTWKLGSYTSNNVLKLGKGQSGNLIFDKTGCYQAIYLLSVCGGVGGGSTSMTAVVNYTDGTSDDGSFTVLDWYTEDSMQATASGTYKRVNSGKIEGQAGKGPMFTKSMIKGLDTSKVVKSITIKNIGTSSDIFLSVFAATGLTADVDVPAPETVSVDTSSFDISWDKADGATSYRVDVSTSSNFTTMLIGYNNKVVNDTSCVVTGLDRNTTYYYRVRSADSKGAQSASCTAKTVKTHKLDVTFNDNGGAGGPGMTDLTESWQLPASVTTPTRQGYTFSGYFSSFINGTKYYDESGKRVYNTVYTKADPERMTVYAQWTIHSSKLTVDANGGVLAGETSYTRKYNDTVEIKDPVHENEKITFLGWTLLDEEGNASTNGSIIKGAGYTTFKFGPENTAVTLKAIWSAPNGSTVVVKDSVTQEVTGENLERMFHHEVTDPEKGLTASDLTAGERELKLTVDKIQVNEEEETPSEVAPIEELLDGSSNESLTYYDISVDKIIDGVTTKLKELPEPVKIVIPLTDELANRTGYSVYRIHEGVAERMSSSRSSTEYYEANGESIIIHTKKFSTYAITASKSVLGEYPEAELNESNNHAATDVQGRYVDSTGTRVYKVDVEWGAMQFVFNKHQKWDPENHVYTEDIKIELDDSAYTNGNNEIVISNHSNADVRVGLSVVEKDMDGVEIYVKQENSDEANDAIDMYLNKVADASGTAPAEQVNAFVRLDSGMLNVAGLEDLTEDGKTGVFQQIARVVITIEAVQDSETTPLYFGD